MASAPAPPAASTQPLPPSPPPPPPGVVSPGRRHCRQQSGDADSCDADLVAAGEPASVGGVAAAVDPRASTPSPPSPLLPSLPPSPPPAPAETSGATYVTDAAAAATATVAGAGATAIDVAHLDAVDGGGGSCGDSGGRGSGGHVSGGHADPHQDESSDQRGGESSGHDDNGGGSGDSCADGSCAGCGGDHAVSGHGADAGTESGPSSADALTQAERPPRGDVADAGSGADGGECRAGGNGSAGGIVGGATVRGSDTDSEQWSSDEDTSSDEDDVETTICVFRIFDDVKDMWLLLNMVAVLVDKPAKDGTSMPSSAVSGHRVDEPLLGKWRDTESLAAAAVSVHLDAAKDDDLFTKRGREEAIDALFATPYALARVPDPPVGVPTADDEAAVFFAPPRTAAVAAAPPVEPVRYLRALVVKRQLPPYTAIMALLLAHRGRLAIPGLAPSVRSLYRLFLGAIEVVGADAGCARGEERKPSTTAEAAAAADAFAAAEAMASWDGVTHPSDSDDRTDEILAAPGLPAPEDGAAVAAALWRALGPAAVVSREDAAAYAWGLMQRYEKLVGCRSGVMVLAANAGGGGQTPVGWQPRRPRVVAVPPADLAKAAAKAARIVATQGTPGLTGGAAGVPRQFHKLANPERGLRWIPHAAFARVLQTVMEGVDGAPELPDEPEPADASATPTADALAAATAAIVASVSPLDAVPAAGRVSSATVAAAAARVAAHPCPVRIGSAVGVIPPMRKNASAMFFRLFLPCPPAEPRLVRIMAFTWWLGAKGRVPPMLILSGLVLAARARDVNPMLVLTDWTAHRLIVAGVGLAASGTRWADWSAQLHVGGAETADAVEVATLVANLCELLGGQEAAVVTTADAAAMEWTLVYWFRRSGLRPGEGGVPLSEAATLQPLLMGLIDDGFDVAPLLPVRQSRRPPVRQGSSRRQRATAAVTAAATEAAATEAAAAEATATEETATEATTTEAAATEDATAEGMAANAAETDVAGTDEPATDVAVTEATATEGAAVNAAASDAEAATEAVVEEAVVDEAAADDEAASTDVASAAALILVAPEEATADIHGGAAGTTTTSVTPGAAAPAIAGGVAADQATTANCGGSRGGLGVAAAAPLPSVGGGRAGFRGGGATHHGPGGPAEGATTDAAFLPPTRRDHPAAGGGGGGSDAAEGATTDGGTEGVPELPSAIRTVDQPRDGGAPPAGEPSAGVGIVTAVAATGNGAAAAAPFPPNTSAAHARGATSVAADSTSRAPETGGPARDARDTPVAPAAPAAPAAAAGSQPGCAAEPGWVTPVTGGGAPSAAASAAAAGGAAFR